MIDKMEITIYMLLFKQQIKSKKEIKVKLLFITKTER